MVSESNSSRPSGTMIRPSRDTCSAGMREMSMPSKCTVPLRPSFKPTSALRKVDLPAPLAPTSATASPSPTVKSMSNTACRSP